MKKYGTGRPMRGDKKKTPVVAIVQRHEKVFAKFRYNRREMGNQQFRAILERVSERAS